VTSQTTTHTSHPRLSPARWRRRPGARAAALSLALTLTAGAASGLAATLAWAAGGYGITATIGVGSEPGGVAVSPDGTRAYVVNADPGTVSVIGTATNQVIATIHGFSSPEAVAAGPGGTHIYVTNGTIPGTVSVITRQ
jgi:YVTN family beta-propeller protein